MTNEELERVMNFIMEQHGESARLTAALARNQSDHERRLKNLEEAQEILVGLARNSDERHDRSEARNERLEEAFQTLADIAARQDERIRTLEGRE